MNEAPGEDLVRYTGADALSTREAVVNARAELARRQLQLDAQHAEAKAEMERQRRELEAQFEKARAELAEQMKPLKEQLAKLAEIMWTVDLYLGRDETLRLIREGSPAPADTPIAVRQKVLVMAEESLILMGATSTGVTSEDIPEFIDWLIADDANLDRILPEKKGVVVLVPTKVKSRSGNIFEDAYRDAENQRSYWLLRNGERLYLLTVDPELKIFDRVLPRRREFVDVFDQRLFGFGSRRGEPVRPGSEEWFELEKIADAKRRHYMRILMVLEGLIDRTPVWHPLPASGASFMSLADQDAGKIVLIQDDEESIQLGEGGETFAQWQRRVNSLLRPGLRVVANFNTQAFRELYNDGDRWSRGGHQRIHPANAEYPPSQTPLLIEARRDNGLVIRYTRTEKIWKRNQPVPGEPGYVYRFETEAEPKQRASCVIYPDDSFVVPFDLVTVAEMERFLASREERSNHFLSMVPTLRAAIAAKYEEAAQEADFRGLIAQLLVTEGADAEDVDELVDGLVYWWKLAHTWSKPLNGDGAHEKNAADQIVAEYRARRKRDADDSEKRMIERGRAIPGAIAVGRDRQGRWWSYSPSPDAHDEGVFLDITRLYRNGRMGETKTSQTVARRTASALQLAWSDERWGSWKFDAHANHYLTAGERRELIEQAKALSSGTPVVVTELFDPKHPGRRSIHVYAWVAEKPPTEEEPISSHDVYSWRQSNKYIERTGWSVVKDSDGVRLGNRSRSSQASDQFSHYSGGTKWGSTPWWPDTATPDGDARPRLIWADEAMLDAVASFRIRCAAIADEEREQRRAAEAAAYAYSQPIEARIEEQIIAQAKARFIEDFGADALDLWPAHLKTLKLRNPIHSRTLWGVVAIALAHGHPVVGQTLDQLADFAWQHENKAPGEWHPPRSRVDFGDFGSIIVTEPASDEDEQP
ncbi:hypothetical protein [Microbacterium maritypicum]|uniref:Uncharacterized protein n=1 Tax=Microbacterium maritypicum MF109 TaxID=1333857 RepID=T5KFD2_MICMQ|nr:hypothetical protein [Microbacterium liquefaciens]EQM74895.1 hypothetical protein L687_05390 [Microbacterium maritypicum MF109]